LSCAPLIQEFEELNLLIHPPKKERPPARSAIDGFD